MTRTLPPPQLQPRRKDYGYSRTVHYDSGSHVSVLLQTYGSVWGKVLPHCIANVALTGLILCLLRWRIVDLTISEWGHQFMSIIVAFLIVSRCTITLSLYFELRGYLSTMFMATLELVQHACVLSARNSQSAAAKEWRSDVAYRAMMLLRVTVAVLNRGGNAWDVPELSSEDRHRLSHPGIPAASLGAYSSNMSNGSTAVGPNNDESRCWKYECPTDSDENLRVPLRMAHMLRTMIASQRERLGEAERLDVYEEQQLLACVKEFMIGYSGISKYLTTPFPFPLVQMARTFLFFYVYTMPFALLSVVNKPIEDICLSFIVTYGFVGIEFVSIELDDPFGEDPNDLPVLGQARSVFDDVCLCILETDGLEYANKLQSKMNPASPQTHSSNGNRASESTALLV